MNLSLISFYGDKPVQLINLIQKLQTRLTNQLIKDKFVPYQLEQIHGTIIGCEGYKTEAGVINKWFYERREETRYIDFPGLVNYLQNRVDFPLNIRFGGCDRHTDYNFLSRNQHLYERSFQLQPADNQTIPVLIGWSWLNNSVSLAIDNLRRDLQQFGLLHKYHTTADDIDNDFYLRLGTIDAKLTSAEIQAISIEIRNWLETQPALHIPVTINDLAFAQYQDLTLATATTKIFPVAKITPSQLEQLYFF
ncbi:hypothetical protein [Pleurocapsa sp. FMAR1]|uniref:hypothetical protein n=1 Tax=Pleurocapsa sp. FMAR1 TaxID=3040204 RepID=UPI0029C9566B|nr:hypothetical protein [Pleurocapsa sp. FMAR1]